MKPVLVIVMCFAQIILNAQDTIYKRSGDVIPARVIEINTKEISYKRNGMEDGPLFILNKDEVKKIKYKTGAVDSFTVYNELPVRRVELKNTAIVYTYDEQLKKHRTKGLYIYHGNTVSDSKAMILATNKNVTWKNKQLESEILNVNKSKALQYTSSLGGLGLGLVVMTSALVYAINEPSNQSNTPPAVFVNGLGIIIASQIVSVHFKIQRIKHSDKAVALYNQNLAQ